MKQSKLLVLLKSMKADELQQFARFIRSSYVTSSKDVVRLFQYLRRYTPEFESRRIEKEKVFQYLFPNYKYSDIKLRNLMRKLTRILEDFLIFTAIKTQEWERKKQLVKVYQQRNLYDHFQRTTFKLIQELEDSPYRDADFFYDQFDLLSQYYFHPVTPKQGRERITINELLEQLHNFYAIEQLRLISELKSRSEIVTEQVPVVPMRNLSLYGQQSVLYDLIAKIVELKEKGEEAMYFEIKALFLQHHSKIKAKDCAFVLTTLLNYAVKGLTSEEGFWVEEIFAWNQFGIEQSILIFDQRISNTRYLNMVISGAKLKKFDWIENFINQYEQFLEPSTKEDTKALAMAFLAFHQQAYDRTIEVMLTHKFTHVLYQINVKTLLIRTYYESFVQSASYYELLNDSCDAFEMFIRRNKTLSKSKKKVNLNFVQFVKKLGRAKNQLESKITRAQLLEQLEEYESITLKDWLKEKVMEYQEDVQ